MLYLDKRPQPVDPCKQFVHALNICEHFPSDCLHPQVVKVNNWEPFIHGSTYFLFFFRRTNSWFLSCSYTIFYPRSSRQHRCLLPFTVIHVAGNIERWWLIQGISHLGEDSNLGFHIFNPVLQLFTRALQFTLFM